MGVAEWSFRTSLRSARAAASLLACLGAACSDATAPSSPPHDVAASAPGAPTGLSIVVVRDTIRVGDVLEIQVREQSGLSAPNVTLSIAPAHVLSLGPTGHAVAHAAGSAVVRAERAGVVVERRITVLDAQAPVAAAISVRPRAATLLPGAALQLVVSAVGADGSELPLASPATLSSSDSGVALLRDGRVHAMREGTATITVRAGSHLSTMLVRVQAPRPSAFSITQRLAGIPAALDAPLATAFGVAAARWTRAIVGDLPAVTVSLPAGTCGFGTPAITETIDDVLVIVRVEPLDGPGGSVASAGPCVSRHDSRLPAIGVVRLDADDLPRLQALGLLEGTIAHELGHVLGIGTLWTEGVAGALVADPHGYVGAAGRAAAIDAGAIAPQAIAVPLEQLGAAGTRGVHWGSEVAGELMTGWIGSGSAAISAVTLGALRDLGYDVLEGAAESLGAAASARAIALVEVDAGGHAAGAMHDRAHGVRFVLAPSGALERAR